MNDACQHFLAICNFDGYDPLKVSFEAAWELAKDT
jgi:hypothetical protein